MEPTQEMISFSARHFFFLRRMTIANYSWLVVKLVKGSRLILKATLTDMITISFHGVVPSNFPVDLKQTTELHCFHLNKTARTPFKFFLIQNTDKI
jgi:hypothetical protein